MSKVKGKQRDPPPSLFLGPPSQNASHVSLPNILIPGNGLASSGNHTNPPSAEATQQATLLRQRSSRLGQRNGIEGSVDKITGLVLPRAALPSQQQALEGQKQADRTEALWAEMQATLEDVELSAINGTHVFSAEHSKALERLRATQISLAQAWARSEADDAVETADKESKVLQSNILLGSDGRSALEGTEVAKSSVSERQGSTSGGERTGSKLEEETEADILLARKRREANDRYFQRVNAGVLDVVAQLEDVAGAMKAVKQESRDIWGESDSGFSSVPQ